MDRSSIGRRIVSWRRSRGWSQLDLANKIGEGPSTLCRWERGRGLPTAVDVERIAAALGVSMSRFYARRLAASPFRPDDATEES